MLILQSSNQVSAIVDLNHVFTRLKRLNDRYELANSKKSTFFLISLVVRKGEAMILVNLIHTIVNASVTKNNISTCIIYLFPSFFLLFRGFCLLLVRTPMIHTYFLALYLNIYFLFLLRYCPAFI